MAERVTIEVEARFVDNLSGVAKQASTEVKDLGDSAEKAEKQVDDLGKKKAKPTVDADDSGFVKKLLNAERKIKMLVGKPVIATLKVMDKGVDVINKVENGLKKVAGKTWSAAVRIKDYATAPLRKVKDMLFSIKSLVLAITAGLAAKKLVMDPVSLADSYSSAKIGFSTLLGDSQGQAMMDDLDAFAKATPFKTSEVIANTQKMIAMGWEAKDIIKDMETIGDAAAATGKGDEGLNRIILALSQIKSKGKLSTEELNQLAEAGISAKRYLAEGLGYGSGDSGIAALSKDLEQGKIGSERAIQAIMAGMKEYKGMMDKTANETAKGLWGQIEDTFEINIFRRWGQGLQDGAKRGLGTVVGLLDKADTSLSKFGNTVYDIGEAFSSWAADKLENTIKRIGNTTDSFEFQNTDLGGKLKLLWKSAVADPFAEWWSDGESVQKATELGESFAKSLTQGILTVLGITDIFADVGDDSGSKGYNVAQGFARGFVDGFDVSAITDKIVEAIGNVWGALPLWAKVLVGGHVAGKALGGILNFAGGVSQFAKGASSFIGKSGVRGAGNVITGASGLFGTMSKAGYALLGGASSVTPAAATLAGGAGIAGGVVGGIAVGKGVYDLYGSYKAYKAGNTTEAGRYARKVISGASKFFPFATREQVNGQAATGTVNREAEDRIFSSEVLFGAYNTQRSTDIYDKLFSNKLELKNLLTMTENGVKALYDDEGDLRTCHFQALRDIEANDGRFFVKYGFVTDGDLGYASIIPILRISEMYLIVAECEKSLTWVNDLRSARKAAQVSSGGSLDGSIEDEYVREFIGEGQLFWYYKRKGITEIPRLYNRSAGDMKIELSNYQFDLPDKELAERK